MRIFSIFILLIFTISLSAQYDTIRVKNSSFEDRPRAGEYYTPSIKSWYDCGAVQFPRETAPDIHPIDFWEVRLPASDGNTYLGMVVRDNESWESVSQRLTLPIERDMCYKFSVDLARSNTYLSGSRSRTDDVKVQYTRPAVLKIWGSNGYCGKRELIAESAPVENFNWESYEFEFKAKSSHLFVTFEAFYKTPVLFPYNGHILVDNISSFIEMSCDGEEALVAEVEVPRPKKEEKPKVEEKEEPIVAAVEVVKPQPKVEKPKTKKINGLLKKDLTQGQKLKIENLLFPADKSTINRTSFKALDEVYEFLEENNNIMIEIGGHTNGNPGISHEYCDKLSSQRARSVAEYLIEKGLSQDRLKIKGYGKRDPIATNETKAGKLKNQRVEIKILSLG